MSISNNLVSRRSFLAASSVSLSAWPLLGAEAVSRPLGRKKAKSTILFFLCGGASHVDTWDMKPDAPLEYRGEFSPIATSSPEIRLSEHLPLLAQQAHHLAVVNSVGDFHRGTGDHHAGYYYNLTGHAPDPTFARLLNNRRPEPTDWPFIGSTVAYKTPQHPQLPNCIALPKKPGAPQYTRPGQFAARLGIEYDPFYVFGNEEKPLEFGVPALKLEAGIDYERLNSRRALLGELAGSQPHLERAVATRSYRTQQEKAFSLLCSPQTKQAFDIAREPESLQERYGKTVNGMSLLMARRMVEAEVPFIAVYWNENTKLNSLCKSAGGWDTHGNNFNCLKDHLLPEFDRGFSALIEDLAEKNLLDETLVMVTSEMGRKPKVGDPRSGGKSGAGRDHWTHCQSVLFAGGGIRGGQTYGSSDRLAEYPADRPVTAAEIAHTVYAAMGIEDLEAVDPEGRPFSLLTEGQPLHELF